MMLVQSIRQQHWRLWSGGACSGAAGKQQPDNAQVSVAPFPVGREGRFGLESRSVVSLCLISFYCQVCALLVRFFFLEHVEGTEGLQLDEKALLRCPFL